MPELQTVPPCTACGTLGGATRAGRPRRSAGLCLKCYGAARYRARHSRPISVPHGNEPRPCRECGTTGGKQGPADLRPVRCRGLCVACHDRQRKAAVPGPPCVDCGTTGGAVRAGKVRRVKGRCGKCDDQLRNVLKKRRRARGLAPPATVKAAGAPVAAFVPRSVPAPEPQPEPPRDGRYAGPLAWLVRAFDDHDLAAVFSDDDHEEREEEAA